MFSTFPSSTNAEDLEGFNGAGLYESIKVMDTSNKDDISKAIKAVWASTWTMRSHS